MPPWLTHRHRQLLTSYTKLPQPAELKTDYRSIQDLRMSCFGVVWAFKINGWRLTAN